MLYANETILITTTVARGIPSFVHTSMFENLREISALSDCLTAMETEQDAKSVKSEFNTSVFASNCITAILESNRLKVEPIEVSCDMQWGTKLLSGNCASNGGLPSAGKILIHFFRVSKIQLC
jgi:hypothetical protein